MSTFLLLTRKKNCLEIFCIWQSSCELFQGCYGSRFLTLKIHFVIILILLFFALALKVNLNYSTVTYISLISSRKQIEFSSKGVMKSLINKLFT